MHLVSVVLPLADFLSHPFHYYRSRRPIVPHKLLYAQPRRFPWAASCIMFKLSASICDAFDTKIAFYDGLTATVS